LRYSISMTPQWPKWGQSPGRCTTRVCSMSTRMSRLSWTQARRADHGKVSRRAWRHKTATCPP
jgi:hypothetical protein